MGGRKRHASVEPQLRPDLRLKENQFMIPLPPEGLTAWEKRKWREHELGKLLGSNSSSAAPRVQHPVQPAPSRPRGKVAAASWHSRQRGQFLTKLGKMFSFGWLFRGGTAVALLLTAALSGQHGPVMQFARILGAAADLSESTADVAVTALNATTQLAAGAGQFMLQAAANGLTTGANLWKGVDLHEVMAQRCHGLVLVDGSEALGAWLNSSQAHTMVPCLQVHLAEQLQAATESLHMGLPMTQTSIDDLNISGHYWSSRVWATFDPSGRVRLTYDYVSMQFVPIWANPLWRGLPLGSERDQILQLLRTTLVSLPRPAVSPTPMVLDIQAPASGRLLCDKCLTWIRYAWLLSGAALEYGWSFILQSGGSFLLDFPGWLGPLCMVGLPGLMLLCRYCCPHKVPWMRRPTLTLALEDGAAGESPISIRSNAEPENVSSVTEDSEDAFSELFESSDGSFEKLPAVEFTDCAVSAEK